MDNTQNKFLETRIEILDVYNMMDPDYERELYKWFFSLAFLTSHFTTPYWKLWIEKPWNMKAASIVNEAYFVEQWKRLRKQLKPIALFW